MDSFTHLACMQNLTSHLQSPFTFMLTDHLLYIKTLLKTSLVHKDSLLGCQRYLTDSF